MIRNLNLRLLRRGVGSYIHTQFPKLFMQEKVVNIERTIVRDLFARLNTDSLSLPGMDTWAREIEGYVLLVWFYE